VVIDTLDGDGDGVGGVVEGDNGIVVAGVARQRGERFVWHPGQTLVLGGALPGEPACTLALARATER